MSESKNSKRNENREDESHSPKRQRQANQEKYAWRFAKADRVRCNIGGDHGWMSGQVASVDHQDDGSELLPYVVKLDKPINRLISVPFDSNTYVRAEVCFSDGPDGGGPAAGVALTAKKPTSTLRFKLGDRVACVTAGPDGTEWPRRWSAGTISALWPRPTGAKEGTAVPYAIKLDAEKKDIKGSTVFASQDNCLYVRSLELQEPGQVRPRTCLERFTERKNEKMGYYEKIDQETMRFRKSRPLAN